MDKILEELMSLLNIQEDDSTLSKEEKLERFREKRSQEDKAKLEKVKQDKEDFKKERESSLKQKSVVARKELVNKEKETNKNISKETPTLKKQISKNSTSETPNKKTDERQKNSEKRKQIDLYNKISGQGKYAKLASHASKDSGALSDGDLDEILKSVKPNIDAARKRVVDREAKKTKINNIVKLPFGNQKIKESIEELCGLLNIELVEEITEESNEPERKKKVILVRGKTEKPKNAYKEWIKKEAEKRGFKSSSSNSDNKKEVNKEVNKEVVDQKLSHQATEKRKSELDRIKKLGATYDKIKGNKIVKTEKKSALQQKIEKKDKEDTVAKGIGDAASIRDKIVQNKEERKELRKKAKADPNIGLTMRTMSDLPKSKKGIKESLEEMFSLLNVNEADDTKEPVEKEDVKEKVDTEEQPKETKETKETPKEEQEVTNPKIKQIKRILDAIKDGTGSIQELEELISGGNDKEEKK